MCWEFLYTILIERKKKMINNVVLVGRLTKDSDLRYTNTGTAVATFTLAVNRNFTNKNGQREADFVNCVIWRKSAEALANYSRKGTLIGVTGRIQTRSYDNQQGQRVFVTEVLAESFQLLESRAISEQRQETNGSGTSNQAPFSSMNQQQTNSSNTGQTQGYFTSSFPSSNEIDISDDDLPF